MNPSNTGSISIDSLIENVTKPCHCILSSLMIMEQILKIKRPFFRREITSKNGLL